VKIIIITYMILLEQPDSGGVTGVLVAGLRAQTGNYLRQSTILIYYADQLG
jgi:hypothetical protein